MQASRQSPKKLYQFILSAKQPSQLLGEAVTSLLRRAVESSEHFDFLLHRINWFEHPFTHYQPLFLKILRLYTGLSKQSSKVAYNLLIEALTHQKGELPLTMLSQLFQESYDKKGIILAIKENYPHKLCPLDVHQSYLSSILLLSKQYEHYRTDLLEIVIENLVHFDTELVLADEWVHRPFPEDQKIKSFRDQPLNDIAHKFDHLLYMLLEHLQEISADPKIIGQLLLVFQNKVLPIKTTKLIQLVIFFLAQKSRQHANAFVSFLLSNIFDLCHKENHYRIFTQSNFYLFSYLIRSKTLTNSSIRKKLMEKISFIKQKQVNERSSLKEIYHEHQIPLAILQSIIMTIISREQVLEPTIKEKYQLLLKECSCKLHFQHFLREEILDKMGLNKNDNKNTIKVKFSNKFLPATLPKIALIVDPTTSSAPIRRLPPCPQDIEPLCRKAHKGETPITYCSQTLV